MTIDDYIKKGLNRRDFLKKSGQVGLAVGVGLTLDTLLKGCATITFKEEAPDIYPLLKGHKVQPPQDGCFIGFHPFSENNPDYYKTRIGKGPKIFIPSSFKMDTRRYFLEGEVKNISNQGAIPFVYRALAFDVPYHGFQNLVSEKEFREDITQYTKDIVKFGKPLFVCTMRELNGDWYPWGQQAGTAKKVWRHMWQIFEDNGANEYATWVWEVYCPEAATGRADYPGRYYPGDKYVDWIGLSAYARSGNQSGTKSFSTLVSSAYHSMRVNYPDKPVMMAEFGKTTGWGQDRWLRNAFKTIKSWPGMKAAILWNNDNPYEGDNHHLTAKSFEVYREIMKDPYFIGAK